MYDTLVNIFRFYAKISQAVVFRLKMVQFLATDIRRPISGNGQKVTIHFKSNDYLKILLFLLVYLLTQFCD